MGMEISAFLNTNTILSQAIESHFWDSSFLKCRQVLCPFSDQCPAICGTLIGHKLVKLLAIKWDHEVFDEIESTYRIGFYFFDVFVVEFLVIHNQFTKIPPILITSLACFSSKVLSFNCFFRIQFFT